VLGEGRNVFFASDCVGYGVWGDTKHNDTEHARYDVHKWIAGKKLVGTKFKLDNKLRTGLEITLL
jgi:hypothetical protein